MKQEYSKNDIAEQKSVLSCPSPQSAVRYSELGAYLKVAREQVELERFGYRDKRFARELCVVIAEVYWLAERLEGTVRIGGEPLPYGLVRDVYRFLRGEHLEHVMARYRTVRYEIRNVKAYLRTALYNAVFELEGSEENEYRSEGAAGAREDKT